VLVGAALPPLEMAALGALVGSLPGALHAGLASGPGRLTFERLGVWAVLIMLLQLVPRLRTAAATGIGWRLDASLRQRAMQAVNRPWGVGHLEDPKVADLLSQVQGVGAAGFTPGAAVSQLIGMRISTTLTALATGALLLLYHWWVAAALLAVLVLSSIVSRRGHARQTTALIGGTRSVRRAQYYRDLALAPAAAKEVRLLGVGDFLIERLRRAWRAGGDDQDRAEGRAFGAMVLASLLVALTNGAAYALLGFDGARGVIDLGALVVYLRAVAGLGALGSLGAADAIIAHGFAGLPAILKLEAAAGPAREEAWSPLPEGAPRREIRFRGVGFAYAGAERAVLKNFDLVIPAGTSMALVGLNGAGKTTLVKLLARLYDPTEGALEVDGVDLRAVDPDAWRQRIGAVFQDFLRFSLPARDNVGFGGLSARADEAALERAAEKAGILQRIRSLPLGWDTPLSRHFTGGAELSGGEWQRIALARALMAVEAGALVLILDEPTANLDVRAEAALYDRFLELTRGLTTLLISHRFATVRRADRICVVEAGAAAEVGSHDELMALGGRYAQMFTLQSARFLDPREGAKWPP
jgi:ATP-binding cassette subfamily B protein